MTSPARIIQRALADRGANVRYVEVTNPSQIILIHFDWPTLVSPEDLRPTLAAITPPGYWLDAVDIRENVWRGAYRASWQKGARKK